MILFRHHAFEHFAYQKIKTKQIVKSKMKRYMKSLVKKGDLIIEKIKSLEKDVEEIKN